MPGRYTPRRFIWRWVSTWSERKHCWVSGSPRPKGRSSGYKWRLNSKTVAYRASSSRASMGSGDSLEPSGPPIPRQTGKLCITYMVRYNLNYVSWKLHKEVALDLRAIYAASMVKEAGQCLSEFAEKGETAYPPILAAQLGAHHPILQLPAGDRTSNLHH